MFKIRCSQCNGVNRVAATKAASGPTCGRCKAALPLNQPIHLDDDDLDALIAGSPVPVLVDFYADWCGPCRQLGPVLSELASSHVGRAIVVKIDVDRFKRRAGQLGVKGIPAVHIFAGGKHVGEQVGLAPKAAYEALLARA